MDQLTLDQLRVLAALHRTGSVSAAARALHRAQSAVSYGLKQLEGALALPLVDHGGYRARLTPEGRAVLAKAEAVLAAMDDLARLSGELRGGAEPELHILLDGILPPALLMPVLARLNARQPTTRITLRVEILAGVGRALEHDRPELVLAPLGQHAVPPHYDHEVIGRITLVPVVAVGHPLAALPPPVSLDEVRRHVHLVVTSPPGLQTPVDAGMVGAERHWNFPDFASRLEGLRAGLGFAWMPMHMVADDLRAGRLAPLVLERNAVHGHDVALYYRGRPPLGPTGRYLLEALRQQAGLLPRPARDLLRRYGMT